MTIKITKAKIKHICTHIQDSQIQNINSFVMFVGHAHSGHSLIGALLDSHPQTAISNHVNIPKLLIEHNLSKKELLKTILYYSLKNNHNEAWINTGYKYQVLSSHQGLVTNPTVLGDKQGGASTRVIMNHPKIINVLKEMFGNTLKLIFVYRNVFDNIAAFAYYMKEDLSAKHVNRYFENLETVVQMKKNTASVNWFQLKHEDFLDSPQANLKTLFEFLNITYTDMDILKATKIVNTKPHERRKTFLWDKKITTLVNRKMDKYSI